VCKQDGLTGNEELNRAGRERLPGNSNRRRGLQALVIGAGDHGGRLAQVGWRDKKS